MTRCHLPEPHPSHQWTPIVADPEHERVMHVFTDAPIECDGEGMYVTLDALLTVTTGVVVTTTEQWSALDDYLAGAETNLFDAYVLHETHTAVILRQYPRLAEVGAPEFGATPGWAGMGPDERSAVCLAWVAEVAEHTGLAGPLLVRRA